MRQFDQLLKRKPFFSPTVTYVVTWYAAAKYRVEMSSGISFDLLLPPRCAPCKSYLHQANYHKLDAICHMLELWALKPNRAPQMGLVTRV